MSLKAPTFASIFFFFLSNYLCTFAKCCFVSVVVVILIAIFFYYRQRQAMTVPKYPIVATDMDGTLLNEKHEITPATKSIIQRLVQKYPPYSLSVVFASGRAYFDLQVLLKEFELPDYSGFIVSSNGARVHRLITSKDGKEKHLEQLYAACIAPEDVHYLLSLLPDDLSQTVVNVYRNEQWLCSGEWTSELQYFQKSGFHYEPLSVPALLQEYTAWCAEAKPDRPNPFDGIDKISFGCGDDTVRESIYTRVESEKRYLLANHASHTCLEFNAANVCKATGLAAVLPYAYKQYIEHQKVEGTHPWTLKDCLAFGDADNDVDILGAVGKGYIMENGSSFLKNSLPHVEVIGRNTEESVARKIEEIFELAS